jgi:uncharacterized membrane protein
MTVAARTFWGLMAFLSVGVAAYAAFHVATGFVYLPPDVARNGFFSPLGLQIHIAASAVALAIGPFQFLRGLRARRPMLHRWMGRTYVTACLVGGASGGAIAMYSSAGPIAGAGFLGLAFFWLVFTGVAFSAARARNFVRHERFMVRSFALTLAAVTLRIYLPIGVTLNEGEFVLPYTIIAWACWVPNLLIAEAYLALRRTPQAVSLPA